MADDLPPELWNEADRIFDEALARPSEERATFVEEACGDNEALLRAVRRLLHAHESAEGFLQKPEDLRARALNELVPPPDPEPSLVGSRVGPYRILRKVGRGGMGAVLLAERADGRYEAEVALKFLHVGVAGEDLTRRFLVERQILASLSHPNIARLLDAGETAEGWPYLVMEYVEGEPVTEYADRHTLSVRERVELSLQICRAVEYAHDRMVIHRDLKASNVLVDAHGHVKLLDFGIAKLLDDTPSSEEPLTRPGERVLTPEYAAPEQLRGEPAAAATDVHQLGALLYRLLVGSRPYVVENEETPSTPRRLERAILHDEPPRPSSRLGEMSPDERDRVARDRRADSATLQRRLRGDLDAILLTAIRKEPEARYSSVRALRRDLERHLEGFPVQAHPPTLRYRAKKLLRRRWGWTAAAAGLVLAGAGLTYAQAVHRAELQAERDRALAQEERAQATADFLVSLFHDVDPAEGATDTLSAISLVDRGTERVRDAFGDDPELRATLLAAVGRAQMGLGTGDNVWRLLLEADSLLQEIRGPEDPERLALLEDLAWDRVVAQQFERARPLWEELLEHRRREAGAGGLRERLALADAKRGAARSRWGQEGDEAEEMLRLAEEAVEIFEEEGEAGSLAHLRAQSDLAAGLRNKGRVEEAEALYQAVVDRHEAGDVEPGPFWEEGLGVGGGGEVRMPDAWGFLTSPEDRDRRWHHERRAHLAEVYNALGVLIAQNHSDRLDEVGEAYRRSYEISRETWGETHDRTLTAHRNLGVNYVTLGDVQRGLELVADRRARKEERFGPEHWRVARTHSDEAQYREHALDDPEGAEEHHRRAVAIYSADLGEHHGWTAGARVAVARSVAAQGRYEEAVALLEEAREAMEREESAADESALARTLEGLRDLHRDHGNDDAARRVEEALAAVGSG